MRATHYQRGRFTVKTVLLVAGVGLVVFALYRVAHAAHAGTSVVSALKHPTLPPDIAELADHPERAKTRTGAHAF